MCSSQAQWPKQWGGSGCPPPPCTAPTGNEHVQFVDSEFSRIFPQQTSAFRPFAHAQGRELSLFWLPLNDGGCEVGPLKNW